MDDERTAGGGDGLRAPIEAVMMVAAEPVPASDIADALGVDQEEADGALRALARSYREEGRGFELREAAGGWRVYSSPRFADVVGRFVVGAAQARLSQAALETLAIIAYPRLQGARGRRRRRRADPHGPRPDRRSGGNGIRRAPVWYYQRVS